jgi:hypothetical protein
VDARAYIGNQRYHLPRSCIHRKASPDDAVDNRVINSSNMQSEPLLISRRSALVAYSFSPAALRCANLRSKSQIQESAYATQESTMKNGHYSYSFGVTKKLATFIRFSISQRGNRSAQRMTAWARIFLVCVAVLVPAFTSRLLSQTLRYSKPPDAKNG